MKHLNPTRYQYPAEVLEPAILCTCPPEVTCGSAELYARQDVVTPPAWMDCTKDICLDPCISEVVQEMWEQGIRTFASCCGHGKYPPSIIVAFGGREWEMKPWEPPVESCRHGNYARHLLTILENSERVWCDGKGATNE